MIANPRRHWRVTRKRQQMQHAPIYREAPARPAHRPRARARLVAFVVGVAALALVAPGLGDGFAAPTPTTEEAPPIAADASADRHNLGAALTRAAPPPSPAPAPAPVAEAPAAPPAPAVVADNAARRERYVVQDGDTLSDIAYMVGASAEALMQENEIDDPDLLYVGDVLLLPPDRDGR